MEFSNLHLVRKFPCVFEGLGTHTHMHTHTPKITPHPYRLRPELPYPLLSLKAPKVLSLLPGSLFTLSADGGHYL